MHIHTYIHTYTHPHTTTGIKDRLTDTHIRTITYTHARIPHTAHAPGQGQSAEGGGEASGGVGHGRPRVHGYSHVVDLTGHRYRHHGRDVNRGVNVHDIADYIVSERRRGVVGGGGGGGGECGEGLPWRRKRGAG